jgi:hypothetical protein
VTHQEGFAALTHQEARNNARLPGHNALWTGHTIAQLSMQQQPLTRTYNSHDQRQFTMALWSSPVTQLAAGLPRISPPTATAD